MLFKLPTAWLQLRYQKTRLIVALAGVVFAVVIIFTQFGLQAALFDSGVRLHKALQGDCFLISPKSPSLIALATLTQRRLSQILAFEQVEFVAPVYSGFVQWRNTQNKKNWRFIFILGFDLRYPIINLPGVQENQDKLKMPDTVLFDRKSRPEFGPVVAEFEEQGSVVTAVNNYTNDRKLEVVGLFELGTSFGVDGSLITSSVNYMRLQNRDDKGLISLGVIKLKPGSNVEAFIGQVNQYLPADVRVLSREEFIEFEKDYWRKATPIGFIFSIGVGLGLVVGIVIVYQILYTNVSEHLPQYATLKAIGYQHRYLLTMVLQQSTFIAILGYIPGWILSQLLYSFTKQATQLPMGMTLERSIWVFALTFFMCFISGATAIRKLQDADPADIF
jgi:putative ABC transport system permease protein